MRVRSGATAPTLTLTGLNNPVAMAFDPYGNLVVANSLGNTVSEFAPGATAPTATLTGLDNPCALAFDASGNLYVANDGTGTVSEFAATTATTPAAGGVAINVPAGQTATLSGISGQGSIEKTGGGTLVLTGSSSYSGSTIIEDGTLQVGSGGITATLGSGTIADESSLVFDCDEDLIVPNSIIGNGGNVVQDGSGTLTLSGGNTYMGSTIINAGTITLGCSNALGYGDLAIDGGTLDLNGQSVTIGSLSGTGGEITDNSPTIGMSTLTVDETTETTYGGGIVDGEDRDVALTKEGVATLAITGSDFYGGGTTVNSGLLVLDANGALGGGLTVAANASLDLAVA